jgi:hypothetical protein
LEKKKEKVITLLDEEKKKGNEKIKEYDRIQRERDQQAYNTFHSYLITYF